MENANRIAIRIAADRDWDQISIDLQLRDITEEEMPRLLYECLLDRMSWEQKTLGILKEIEELRARIEITMSA